MNVTIKIEDDLCREARHRAVDRGLSLSGWIAGVLRRELAAGERAGGSLLGALAMEEGEQRAFEIPRDASTVGTTLNIDDDVLETAKALAVRDRKPLGKVVSDTMRDALGPAPGLPRRRRNGILLFPVRPDAGVVTPEHIAALNDESK